MGGRAVPQDGRRERPGGPADVRRRALGRHPGCGGLRAFAARVEESLTRLAAAHAGGRIAVFTHGGVIAQALASATGARPFAFLAPDNGSISRLVRLGGLASIRGFNDVSHLDWSAPAPLT
ncbi:histidine phosphatase family protein [Actinomadura madurae]|nr:histidine phosphatase family protein [Actinomadura madurae]MCP9966206.1 histidine phosphatase family protein [Actinomadura madurae]